MPAKRKPGIAKIISTVWPRASGERFAMSSLPSVEPPAGPASEAEEAQAPAEADWLNLPKLVEPEASEASAEGVSAAEEHPETMPAIEEVTGVEPAAAAEASPDELPALVEPEPAAADTSEPDVAPPEATSSEPAAVDASEPDIAPLEAASTEPATADASEPIDPPEAAITEHAAADPSEPDAPPEAASMEPAATDASEADMALLEVASAEPLPPPEAACTQPSPTEVGTTEHVPSVDHFGKPLTTPESSVEASNKPTPVPTQEATEESVRAATSIQNVRRGQKARREVAKAREQKSAASTLQAKRRDQMDRRERAQAASKLQASRRSQNERRERAKQEQSAVKMQSAHRGMRSRRKTKESSLLTLLGGHSDRQARKGIETLLKHEAIEEDKLLIAQRRLLARSNPATFLRVLHKDHLALDKWLTQTTERHPLLEATLRMQHYFRARPFLTIEAHAKMENALRQARQSTRQSMADIKELLEANKGVATRFFNVVSPHYVKKIKESKQRLRSLQASTNPPPPPPAGVASPPKPGAGGSRSGSPVAGAATTSPGTGLAVAEHKEFDERISKLRSHIHVVRTMQEEVLKNEKKLRELERLLYRFADKKEAKRLKAHEDPYGPGGLIKLMKQIGGRAGSPIATPKNLRQYRNRWRVAERNELLAEAIAKTWPANAHEELLVLRQETETVERLEFSVVEANRALAVIRKEPGAVSMPRSLAALPHREPDSRPISRVSRVSRPGSRVGLGHGVPSPPRTAPASSHGKRNWPPLEAPPPASMLWECSPSTGWHAHNQLAALPRSSSSSSLPALTMVTPEQREQLSEAGLMAPLEEEADAIERPDLSTNTALRPGRGPRIVSTYKDQLPWTPMRYDYPTTKWCPSPVPISNPPERERLPRYFEPQSERMKRMKNARSLPSLLASTYVKEPRKFNPYAYGGFIR